MKSFTSKEEGTWEEIIPVPQSQNNNEEVAPESIPVSEKDFEILQRVYLTNKPKLAETDSYALTVVRINLEEDICVSGLLVATINGNYVRLEF